MNGWIDVHPLQWNKRLAWQQSDFDQNFPEMLKLQRKKRIADKPQNRK